MIVSKNRIVFLTCAFVWTSLCYAMEENSMQQITKWRDVKPLVNKIVAYETDSFYFGSENGYSLKPESSIKYGYIDSEPNQEPFRWSSGRRGYELLIILKNESGDGFTALNNDRLAKSSLSMRFASDAEAFMLLQAINDNKAKISYAQCPSSQKALDVLQRLAYRSFITMKKI
jgi:hypothetical protein